MFSRPLQSGSRCLASPLPTPAFTRAISTGRSPSTAPRRRINKRTAAITPPAVLSSLTSLYHFTPAFLPLSPSLVDPAICSAFASPKSNSKPEPVAVATLTAMHTLITAERGILSGPAWVTSFPELSSSLARPPTYFSGYQDEPSFRDSFMEPFKRGSEAPLRRRWRRVIDTLHGTEAGGQAGVMMLSVSEKAGEVMQREKQERDQEKSDLERKEADMERLYSEAA